MVVYVCLFFSKSSQDASQQVSGKELAAVSFPKSGPKILFIRITEALGKRANSRASS